MRITMVMSARQTGHPAARSATLWVGYSFDGKVSGHTAPVRILHAMPQ